MRKLLQFCLDDFNIIQYQMMQARLTVNSSNVPSRTVGKFYQTQKVTPFTNTHNDGPQQPKDHQQVQQIKTRTKSVGHIYNTKSSASKEKVVNTPSVTPSLATRIDYDRLINYNEVEKKLSNYLQCTIRTNSRQKYNYLSSHYNPRYESLASNQLRMEQNYGNNRQQNLLRVVQNSTNHQSGVLQQRKSSLNNLTSAKKTSYKEEIIQKKAEKENQVQKSEKKSLKNSRKAQSKQLVRSKQESLSKNYNKENAYNVPTQSKKQTILELASINHEQHKNELENKLKKLINNYQIKNKELENQLKKIQTKVPTVEPEKKILAPSIETETSKDQLLVYNNEELKEALSKLIQFNLKGINLNKQCDGKHQQIWKSIHQQIIADQQLRIIKCFINESNINLIFGILNENRMKKLDISVLKTHPDEYDPFLIEKAHEFLKNNNPNLTHKLTCKWICEQFSKFYQLSQKNWLKNLSQQKMECIIRTMTLQKQVTGLRKTDMNSKQLLIRDFTRYLSTLFKANLRNRNVFQIYNKIKSMSYIGRFIELLEQKAGKGVDIRKAISSK